MKNLIDPNRENRVHVVNVMHGSGKNKDKYNIVLSDGSHVAWDVWCGMSQEERRKQ